METPTDEWHASTETLAPGVVRYRISEGNRPLSFSQVAERWQTNAFARWFNRLLASFEYGGFFWECRPVTALDIDEPFEFVLLRARALDSVPAESGAFREHFEGAADSTVLVFPNLGGDAALVVPTPLGPLQSYAHLGEFTRRGPDRQQVDLWNAVGMQVAASISEKPVWLSTCGLGVYWLHVRLDSWPKYYQFGEYRNVTQ